MLALISANYKWAVYVLTWWPFAIQNERIRDLHFLLQSHFRFSIKANDISYPRLPI